MTQIISIAKLWTSACCIVMQLKFSKLQLQFAFDVSAPRVVKRSHTHCKLHGVVKVLLYLMAPNFCMASTRLATVAPNKSRTRTTTDGSGAVKPCVKTNRLTIIIIQKSRI